MSTLDDSMPAPVAYRELPGHPCYRAGDDGTVWTCHRHSRNPAGAWKQLKPSVNSLGYHRVNLGNGRRHASVHRLVLEAFVGPCPEGMECRHLNGDPRDNRLGNLAWGTRRENADDMERHGTRPRGTRHGMAKLTGGGGARVAFALRRRGWSLSRIAHALQVTKPTILSALRGKTWGHVDKGGCL